uniref:Uncharacterized protein n=1 Tax=Ananas comosus var. bracteatus TaxID=296719 RepID=A0A6V7PZL6_ANACO|nr:unnamed protein product [Ananas comosus var. bracteatus]
MYARSRTVRKGFDYDPSTILIDPQIGGPLSVDTRRVWDFISILEEIDAIVGGVCEIRLSLGCARLQSVIMAQGTWEADKMLDVYIYDYLLKRNLQATAKSFMAEGKVATDPVAIDAPGGFLFEWWSVFWDIFIARTNGKHSEVASAYLEVQQLKTREQQQLQMQQLQLMNQRHPQIHRRDVNHPAINGVINSINSDAILASPTASVLAAKIYEERMKHPNSMDSEASSQILDASRLNLLKSAASPGQLVQGNSLNVSPLQLIQARNQQSTEIKNELGVPQRSLPMDASSLYGQGIMQGKSGLAGAGLNQGVSGPLKGWPLTTGIDPLRQNLGIQKPLISSQTQFQVFLNINNNSNSC